MIAVCGTETRATRRWSPNAVPCPVSPNVDGLDATSMQTGTGVHGDSSNFEIRALACWIHSLRSAAQWGVECSGVNTVPLVSVLQTRSSRMFVFEVLLVLVLRYYFPDTPLPETITGSFKCLISKTCFLPSIWCSLRTSQCFCCSLWQVSQDMLYILVQMCSIDDLADSHRWGPHCSFRCVSRFYHWGNHTENISPLNLYGTNPC